MHAPVFKHTTPNQLVGLALALGLAASLALNVVMLSRSDGHEAATISTQTNAGLFAQQQRYYAAKETRQNALEAAAGAQAIQTTALSASQRAYTDLKADQLNGITSASSAILSPALQGYYGRKSDQMNGITTQLSTTLTPSLHLYSDLKADQLNGSMTQPSTNFTSPRQLYVDLKSDQMNGIASTDHAASWQRYVDLKSDQMDGIAPGQ